MTARREEWLPVAMLRGWFDEALAPADPRPSDTECEALATRLRILFNRQQNAELERLYGPQPMENLKDVDPQEEINKRVEAVREAANVVLVRAEELENYAGGYVWEHLDGTQTSLGDIRYALSGIGAVPFISEPQETTRGRHVEDWHAVAPEFAREFKAALHKVGHKKRLGAKDSKSITAFMGAKAISRAYRIPIQPKGFVAALLKRNRKKRDTAVPSDRVPGSGVGRAVVSRSPAGLAGVVRLPPQRAA
jgi:hypothetical protein